jgi:surface carbohydrate biosynthesis protein
MKRILLFTDSKWRDLPGNVLLKQKLERYAGDTDLHVQLCSYHLWNEAITLYAPHLVVLNHIQGKRNKQIASYVKRHGGNVAVMFNEGIVEFEGKARVFESQKNAKNVDIFICWNDVVSDLVGGETFGSPRFDFYAKPTSKAIDSRGLFCDKYNLDESREIILLGDSWPSAKFTYSLQSFHRSNWSDLDNVLADKWSDADEFAQSQMRMQEQFKLYVLLLQNHYPDSQIVIKSHPMSDFVRWQNWCGEHGVTLIHGEYIFNALNACDLYLAKLGSITTAEAWLLHKPVIKIGKDYDSASSIEQFDCDSYNSNDATDVIGIITDEPGVASFVVNDRHNAYLDKWGLKPNDASTKIAKRLLDFIDSMPVNEPHFVHLAEAITRHDSAYSKNAADGFGNWDKAILQLDVKMWAWKLSQIDRGNYEPSKNI